MLNFEEELKKYNPVLTLEEVEDNSKNDEVKDVLDLLNYIIENISKN